MSKLVINNLGLYYGEFHALKLVHLETPANEITAFIGPPGCDKSALLKSPNRVSDLVKDCRIIEEMLLDSEDIHCDLDISKPRKKVGMVFQKPNLFPMGVYDNIAFEPGTYRVHVKTELDGIVERSLKQATVRDEAKDKLGKSVMGLSGGQQQRPCIAYALTIEPGVLLMDEPVSTLNPISASKVEDLVIELRKKYSIIMVTHNM